MINSNHPDNEEKTEGPKTESEIKKEDNLLEQCEKEKKEYLEGWQRARADFINYKRDEGKRMEDLARFIIAGLMNDLLPALDSFDLALKNIEEGGRSAEEKGAQGILLIRSQMMDILKKRGFEKMPVKKGEEFNPEKHESVGEIESDLPVGSIADEVQSGYSLRDKIIRPARVRLAKTKAG